MNKFEFGYMVNPILKINKVFREKVEKLLKETIHTSTMSGIRNFIKKNTCVIALVIFDENITTNPMRVFMVLNCILYSVIDNYV